MPGDINLFQSLKKRQSDKDCLFFICKSKYPDVGNNRPGVLSGKASIVIILAICMSIDVM